jgi:hypothetical protein
VNTKTPPSEGEFFDLTPALSLEERGNKERSFIIPPPFGY